MQKMKTLLYANFILFIRFIMLKSITFLTNAHNMIIKLYVRFKTPTCIGAKAYSSGNLKYIDYKHACWWM
jgi:hypothetical protein